MAGRDTAVDAVSCEAWFLNSLSEFISLLPDT
jgi:hypothetical protein